MISAPFREEEGFMNLVGTCWPLLKGLGSGGEDGHRERESEECGEGFLT